MVSRQPPAVIFIDPPEMIAGRGPWRGQYWPRPACSTRDGTARRRYEERQSAAVRGTGLPTRWRAWRVLSSGELELSYPSVTPELPAPAAQIAAQATAAGAVVRATHSLCESASEPRELLNVVVLRVRVPDGDAYARGWASWHNGRFSSAQWWAPLAGFPRGVGAGEFTALATGRPYEPPAPRPAPPTGPCPRCARAVRWKLAPITPYAHNRSDTGERCA
jgi:hypothetical protein